MVSFNRYNPSIVSFGYPLIVRRWKNYHNLLTIFFSLRANSYTPFYPYIARQYATVNLTANLKEKEKDETKNNPVIHPEKTTTIAQKALSLYEQKESLSELESFEEYCKDTGINDALKAKKAYEIYCKVYFNTEKKAKEWTDPNAIL